MKLNDDIKQNISDLLVKREEKVDIFQSFNEILQKRERVINYYVQSLHRELLEKNTELIYYYLKNDNDNIKPYLMNKTKIMKIHHKKYDEMNFLDIYRDIINEFKFIDIADDIIKLYNEIILNLYNYIILHKDYLLKIVNICKIPTFNIFNKIVNAEILYVTLRFDDMDIDKIQRRIDKEYAMYKIILFKNYNIFMINRSFKNIRTKKYIF